MTQPNSLPLEERLAIIDKMEELVLTARQKAPDGRREVRIVTAESEAHLAEMMRTMVDAFRALSLSLSVSDAQVRFAFNLVRHTEGMDQ